MIERLSKMSCIERTSNLSRASLRRSRYLTFLPIYAILPDSTNAMNGSSKPRNFYRELPDGERRVQRSIVNTSRSFAPNGFEVAETAADRRL